MIGFFWQVLTLTYFLFEGIFCEQTEGAAMGLPLALVITHFCMEHFEELALRTAHCKLTHWFKYTDDTFVL
jgi:hypothetical protein